MLVATIFYPFGYDQAVFSVGGEMVRNGALPIRDFLDTKPPLIFYLYAAASAMFGHHMWAPHAFDVIYQLLACYYFFRVLRRYCSVQIAIVAVSLTEIMYAGSGFWMTAQAESFALIPSVLLLDVTLRAIENSSKAFILGITAAVATATLFLLKITFVFGGVASILVIIATRKMDKKATLYFLTGFFLSAFIIGFVGLYILWQADAITPYREWLEWLLHYSSLPSLNRSALEDYFVIFPERLIYSMSLSLFLLAVLGYYFYRRMDNLDKGKTEVFYSLLALTFILQLAGILFERKFEFPYQYTRALWAISPFMAIGIFKFCEAMTRQKGNRRTVMALAFILLLTIFSPMPRLFTQTFYWPFHALRKDRVERAQLRVSDYFATEQIEVARYLSKRIISDENVFLWGNDVGIYYYLRKDPGTLCLTATPLRTSFTPVRWKASLLSQLQVSSPSYFVVEFGDAKPYITGSSLDSYHSLVQWTELFQFLTSRYSLETTIGHFYLFKRR